MPVPLWHMMLGHTLRLMSDKQKYKLDDCSPEAGDCRRVIAVKNTQPESFTMFKYNHISP